MSKFLVFDMSNLLYRTFYAHKSEDDITIAGLAHHTALTTLNKYFKVFKPSKIVMCFDRSNWRKEYTQSDDCVSKNIYKGNRRQTMTPKEKKKYQQFLEHLGDFENMMREHASSIVLAADKLEADDLIAGFVEIYSMDMDNEIVVVSGDKDLMQLLRYSNVSLIDPASGKPRTLDDWDGDADLFMFEKCIRGDRGDNVQSALPRCKQTRILKAYNDPLERANLMHDTWNHPDGREMVVNKLFKENQLLMDLRCQPEDIQKLIVSTVLEGMNNPGTFSYFQFMKFLGKYELKKITEQAELFTPMLSR